MSTVVFYLQFLYMIIGLITTTQSAKQQAQADLGCQEESHAGVTWSANNVDPDDAISSDPMCLDESKFTIYRQCINEEWSPLLPPDCNYDQKKYEEKIPEGFIDVTYSPPNIAIYRTEPKPWNNSCKQLYYMGPFSDYFIHIPTSNDFFWLPVKRPRSYFPFLKTIGYYFGEVADEFTSLVDAEECLISNFDGSIIKSANCTDHYPEVCLKDTSLANIVGGFCSGAEFTTRFFTTEKCFNFVASNDPIDCDYYQVKSWHENEIITEIFKYYGGNCRIQIDPFEGQEPFDFEKWQNNIDNINFSNWESGVKDGQLSGFVVAERNGRWKLADSYNRALCVTSVEMKTPQLFLAYNYITSRLEFTIFNYEFIDYLPKCYTTYTDALLTQITVEGPISTNVIQIPDLIENGIENPADKFITKAIYDISIDNIHPGEYWCSVQSFPGYHILNSNVVITEGSNQGRVVFGVYVNSSFFCNLENCLNAEPIRNLELSSTVLKTKLQESNPQMDIPDVRAMEILDVTFDEVEILFHVTITLDEGLIPELLDPFQFTANDDIHFRTQMNFIHFVIDKLTLSPLYHIPKSKLHHIFYCVSEIEDSSGVLRLISAPIGEKAVIPKLCLNDDLVITFWECVGQFPFGARWLSTEMSNCGVMNIPPHTQELFTMAFKPNLTLETMNQINEITSEELLNPTDLFLVGISFQKFHTTGLGQIQSRGELQVVHSIMSNVLGVSKGVAQLGNIHLNASNIILSSYEQIFSSKATNTELITEDSFDESGVTEFNSSTILTFVIDPVVQNISGVALFRRDDYGSKYKDNDFNLTDVDIRYLIANESISDLLEDDLLESAMIFPEDLLNSIKTGQQPLFENSIETPLRIIMSIMRNDVLFQPTVTNISEVPVGRVLMASIPWFDVNLKSLFLYFLKIDRNLTSEDEYKCGYWNFHSGSGNESEWSDEGCFFIGIYRNMTNPIAVCGCTHLTSFAFLMTGRNDLLDVENLSHHMRVLDLITMVGCFLSLAGIIMIWITAALFRSWRRKKGSKVLIHLSLGIASQNVLILIPNFMDIGMSQKLPCLIFGVSLHYSVLVVFAWMLIAAYFQYLRFVTVFKSSTTRIILKSCIVGYIVPLLPIAVILIIDFDLYVPYKFINEAGVCYPQGKAFQYGVILPVLFIIFFNIFVFGTIIYNITCGLRKNDTGKKASKIHMNQLRLIIFLFFLLGFNWIFGIFINFEWESLIFSYLFCVTGSLQGLTLFVYFIMLDPNTRSLWISSRKYNSRNRTN